MGEALTAGSDRKCTACINCRRLKVKCVQSDPSDATSPCLRCMKRKKECTYFPGKRKYRSDHLDLRIDNQYDGYARPAAAVSENFTGPQAFRVYQLESIPRFQFTTAKVNSIRNRLTSAWQEVTEGEKLQNGSIEQARGMPFISDPRNNVIAQGILTREECQRRIQIYNEELYPMMPVVKLPEVSFDEFLNQYPLLFHAVMDVTVHLAGGPDTWTDQERDDAFLVHNLVYQSIVYEAFIVGTKNIELIQALLVLLNWFNDPYFHHRKKIHLLFASLVALACDCGLGVDRPLSTSPEKARTYLDQIIQPHLIDENLTPDCVKLWIGLYQFTCHHISSFVSRVTLEWSTYLDSCIKVVKTLEPEVQTLVALSYYAHFFERATRELMRRNNQPTALDVDEPGVQYLVEHIDADVEALHSSTRGSNTNLTEALAYYAIKTYLHQLVLYCPYNDKIGRASFTVYSLNFERAELGPFAVKSFVSCYKNALKCIETVLQCSPRELLAITMQSMSHIFMCSAVVVKCRMLCMFNKHYHHACPVPDSTMDTVADLTTFFDAVAAQHTAAKTLSTMSFIIKVILCRTDAIIYSVMQERDRSTLDIQRFNMPKMPENGFDGPIPGYSYENMTQIAKREPDSPHVALHDPVVDAGVDVGVEVPLSHPIQPQQQPQSHRGHAEPHAHSLMTPPAHHFSPSPKPIGIESSTPVSLPENNLQPPLAPDVDEPRRPSETMSMTELWDFADQFLWGDCLPSTEGCTAPSFEI